MRNGSYATDTNTLFVRGIGAADLTDTTNQSIYAADLRATEEELHLVKLGTQDDVYRICHTHAGIRSPGDESDDAPNASLSWCGRFAIWKSWWNGNSQKDVFIVKPDLSVIATFRPSAVSTPVATSRPTATAQRVTIPLSGL